MVISIYIVAMETTKAYLNQSYKAVATYQTFWTITLSCVLLYEVFF